MTGLKTVDGGAFEFAAVVSNSDVVRTHEELLDGPAADRFLKKDREPACSGVVLYLGLKEKYDHLLHHNFVFSADPHAEFEQIYRQGVPADDPTAYRLRPGDHRTRRRPARRRSPVRVGSHALSPPGAKIGGRCSPPTGRSFSTS